MKAPFEAGITIEDLTVVRGGHMALTDVTFEVGPGVLMGVLGPNGAGKSTLFDAIARVLPITQGTVDWFAFIADGSGTIVDHYRKEIVGKPGLEPGRLSAHDPKSCSSTNSDTPPATSIIPARSLTRWKSDDRATGTQA